VRCPNEANETKEGAGGERGNGKVRTHHGQDGLYPVRTLGYLCPGRVFDLQEWRGDARRMMRKYQKGPIRTELPNRAIVKTEPTDGRSFALDFCF
jgi:hypothetical protein